MERSKAPERSWTLLFALNLSPGPNAGPAEPSTYAWDSQRTRHRPWTSFHFSRPGTVLLDGVCMGCAVIWPGVWMACVSITSWRGIFRTFSVLSRCPPASSIGSYIIWPKGMRTAGSSLWIWSLFTSKWRSQWTSGWGERYEGEELVSVLIVSNSSLTLGLRRRDDYVHNFMSSVENSSVFVGKKNVTLLTGPSEQF